MTGVQTCALPILDFEPATNRTFKLAGASFASIGTVKFGGTGQITLTGGASSFCNVVVANTHASGVLANTSLTAPTK